MTDLPPDTDTRLLRYFVVLAEELHFGRAAARLFIAQSSLSHQIRKLETDLGIALFTRTTRQVQLTEAGERLAGSVQAPLSALRSAVRAAQQVGRGNVGVLRVGFVGSAANELTPRILEGHARRAPLVDVELVAVAISDPTAGVLSGSTDVGFVRDFLGHDAMDAVALFSEPRVYVLPEGHPLAMRASLAPADVAGEPTIALVSDLAPVVRGTWRELDTTSQPRRRGGRAASIDAWLGLIAAGRGVTTAPESTARYFARPGLAFVPAPSLPSSVVSLAWRRDGRTPAVDQFIASALEAASTPNPAARS